MRRPGFAAVGVIFGVVLVATALADAHADTPTPSPGPQTTPDIVLTVEDAYETGDVASISIRNDGDVPYVYNPSQEVCNFTFRDGAGREFEIPPATHCDLPGDRATMQPGETVVLEPEWTLDECAEPGFFCWAVRPLPTGQYTISGSLSSADGLYRAEFSRTVHITGPQFTSDVQLSFRVVVTDPPVPGDTFPVAIELRNAGQREYRYALTPGCYLRFYKPEGYRFTATGAIPCDTANEDTVSPGETVTVVAGWNRDECTEFGQGSTCLKAAALAPGTYTVKGALWSADGQAYAEFSNTLVIQAAQATPSPSPGPGDFPKSGGSPVGGDTSGPDAAAMVVMGLVFVGLGVGALRPWTRRGQRGL